MELIPWKCWESTKTAASHVEERRGLYLCSIMSDSVLNKTWKKAALLKALYAHIYTYLLADGQHTSQSKCQTYQGVCNSKEEWKANYYTNGEKRATLGFEAVNGWRTTGPLTQYCDLCCLQSWLFMKQSHILHGNWSPYRYHQVCTVCILCCSIF